MTLHKIFPLFAKLPFPHWMNLNHDNFPPCLTLQNPLCLSLRFLPFSTSNVWTKIILHHVWRLCKIFKSHSFYLFYFSFLSLPDFNQSYLHQSSQKNFLFCFVEKFSVWQYQSFIKIEMIWGALTLSLSPFLLILFFFFVSSWF